MGTLLSAVQWRTDPPPDWLSMLLFEPPYLQALLEIGYNDAKRQRARIEAFFERRATDPSPQASESLSTRS
jgi:NTE family protein